jgi:hypothetical protein
MGADLASSKGDDRMLDRPDIGPVLEELKDFQQRSVEHAFRRLYLEPETSGRFLVADEVGLGKTMVAKGIIAKAIDYLWEREERIDILYICSNADIARQNIRRLRLGRSGESEFAFATRSTLLPIKVNELQSNKVNYISLTPGTSFEMKSSLGMGEERVLLYWLLRDEWDLKGTSPLNLFQGDVGLENFRRQINEFRRDRIDRGLQEAFLEELKDTNLRERFEELCDSFRYGKERSSIPYAIRAKQNELIGELRTTLAVTCLGALNPDLIIMDEFQRFKHLFQDGNDAGALAGRLFKQTEQKTGTKILLLSATPYKMYTLYEEAETDDHYGDFLDTLSFLNKDSSQTQRIKQLLSDYRKEMYRISEESGVQVLRSLKNSLETELKNVMIRTERLSASEDRNGMLAQVLPEKANLTSADVADYVLMQSIAAALEEQDVLEYWKTAPYLLNFMDQYTFKNSFEEALELPVQHQQMMRILSQYPTSLLSAEDLEKYKEIDPRNMRLRGFIQQYMDSEIWKLLWMPPALSYYRLSGSYAEARQPTKRLLFSSWKIVPKVLATLVSYEAERQMFHLFETEPENTPEARARRRGLLQFASTDNRLTGMPVLTLLYPSDTLARLFDPLSMMQTNDDLTVGDHLKSVDQIIEIISGKLEGLLEEIETDIKKDLSLEDEAWYWAAPILLDNINFPERTKAWFLRDGLSNIWQLGRTVEEDDSHWADHVERVRALLRGEVKLGRPPKDLAVVLAYIALGSPAICAYRALIRVGKDDAVDAAEFIRLKDAAAQIGWSFRSLYNVPEVTALIRGLKKVEPYWRKALEYGVDGCLQAVIDEYVHLLDEGTSGALDEISTRFHDVLTLRATTLSADDIRVEEEIQLTPGAIRLRARFAQRFGDEKSENGDKTRSGQLRDAFNSPFWPFVLTTTSVGQEGLDFHPYCHAIVHWDLPSNPVDMEQREGRVHRYKGHAVRKNIARKHGSILLDQEYRKDNTISSGSSMEISVTDPWKKLFAAAAESRNEDENDLVPYWLFPLEDGYKIERHVPTTALSRDFQKLTALRRSLAVYRMVFGQPRQEDLIQFLLEKFDDETVQKLIGELRIDLSPQGISYPLGKKVSYERNDRKAGAEVV